MIVAIHPLTAADLPLMHDLLGMWIAPYSKFGRRQDVLHFDIDVVDA